MDDKEVVSITHMGRAFRFSRKAGDPYLLIRGLKGHPIAYADGSVGLHRFILFEHLGRPEKSPCHWCGHLLPWRAERDFEFSPGQLVVNVDHVDFNPENNEVSNLVPSCWWCNTGRGWGRFYPEFWEKWLGIMGEYPPQFRISMREIAEEEGQPNPYIGIGPNAQIQSEAPQGGEASL